MSRRSHEALRDDALGAACGADPVEKRLNLEWDVEGLAPVAQGASLNPSRGANVFSMIDLRQSVQSRRESPEPIGIGRAVRLTYRFLAKVLRRRMLPRRPHIRGRRRPGLTNVRCATPLCG
jgi:hypothetical protein